MAGIFLILKYCHVYRLLCNYKLQKIKPNATSFTDLVYVIVFDIF
jgi:hypothetical protein